MNSEGSKKGEEKDSKKLAGWNWIIKLLILIAILLV